MSVPVITAFKISNKYKKVANHKAPVFYSYLLSAKKMLNKI